VERIDLGGSCHSNVSKELSSCSVSSTPQYGLHFIPGGWMWSKLLIWDDNVNCKGFFNKVMERFKNLKLRLNPKNLT